MTILVSILPDQIETVLSFDLGLKNLAYCLLSIRNGKTYIHEWNIINLLEGGRKHNIYNIYNIYTKVKTILFRELDKRRYFLDVSTVLIEMQHKHASELIKNIGVSIHDYFVLRGIMDKGRDINIVSVEAKHKLTIYEGPSLSCTLKTPYARNKWYGEKYCEWWLRDYTSMLNYFKTFTKRDDLADAFLQGVWYLKYGRYGKQGIISAEQKQLRFAEQNVLKYQKIKRGISKQSGSKHLTLSNLKYNHEHGKLDPKSIESIKFFFGTVDYFRQHCTTEK